MNKRVVWSIAVSLAVIAGVAAGLRLLFPGRFDAVRWQAADSPDALRRRHEMIRDVDRLIDDHTIESKPTAVHYLGQPQRRDADSDNVWLYDLGAAVEDSMPRPHSWL